MASKDKETGPGGTGMPPHEDNEKMCPVVDMQGICPMIGPMVGIPPMAMQTMMGWPPMNMPPMNMTANMPAPGMVQGGTGCPMTGEMVGIQGPKYSCKYWEDKFQTMYKKIEEIHRMVHDIQRKIR